MLYRVFVYVFVALAVIVTPATPAHAAQMQNRGLGISPLRQEVTVKPSESKGGHFTISNLTDKPMIVDLSVQQFSVTDYVYDYKFLAPPKNDWIKLRETSVVLQSGKSQKLYYDVSVPAKTTPGGYYFSLFASTKIAGEGLPGTVQAASLLYLVVDGKLVRTSVLQNDTIPFLVTDNNIPYKFDVKNTGNVHFSAYFYGQTESLFGKGPEVGTGHILMPSAVRTVNGTIPSPMLPGIYKVTYGYKVDFAQIVITKSTYVLVAPPWSIVLVVFVLLAGRWLWQRQKARKSSEAK